MPIKKNEQEERLNRLAAAFRQTYAMLDKGVEALAGIYHEAVQLDAHFGDRLRDSGVQVSREFLDCLLLVAEGRMYPAMLLQMRGYTRLKNMTVDDQKALCTTGVMVYVPGTSPSQEKIPLCSMSDEMLQMVVTTMGRIRSVKEQEAYLKNEKKPSAVSRTHKCDYTVMKDGIRFNTSRVWTLQALEKVVREWKSQYGKLVK